MSILDEVLSNGPEYINALVNDSASLAQFLNESLVELYERSDCYGSDELKWRQFVTPIAVLVGVAALSLVLLCCRCSEFNKKPVWWETEYKNRFDNVEKEALKQIRSEAFITEQIVVEDVESEVGRREKKKTRKTKKKHDDEEAEKKKKKKHDDVNRNKDDENEDTDVADTTDGSDDEQIINIENSVVYITSNPPSPKHLKNEQ